MMHLLEDTNVVTQKIQNIHCIPFFTHYHFYLGQILKIQGSANNSIHHEAGI